MGELIYLDNGATSFPKPEEVYSYMDHFSRSFGVNPGRSGYDLCLEAAAVVDCTRQMLASHFDFTDPNRLCFSYNSTDALNLIIFDMLRPGDHAISTTIEHKSVLWPLFHVSRDGVDVDYAPFDGAGLVDPDEIRKRFRPNARLVIVNHASNVIGTVQPIREIGRTCREGGIPFAIDASQPAGKIPIDMDEQFLVGHDIACRTGLHCAPSVHEQLGTAKIRGAVRFGIGPFNTEEHILTAIEAVREIASLAER